MRVAGFGFRTGATVASLQAALDEAGGGAALVAIATAADKAETPVFKALADALSLPIRAIGRDEIEAAEVTSHTAKSQTLRGTGSLSEAAALAGAGEGARLVAPRVISADRMATCAIAKGTTP